jgi:hypothetical protein
MPVGNNPWAILLCKWNDDPSTPFSTLCVESLFGATGVGLNNMVDFFRLYTHGNIDLSLSQVFGWFTLSQTRSQYTGSGVNNAGRQDLINWCIAAATAAGVDVTPFFGVVCCLNDSTDLFGDLGLPRVVCDIGSLNPARARTGNAARLWHEPRKTRWFDDGLPGPLRCDECLYDTLLGDRAEFSGVYAALSK